VFLEKRGLLEEKMQKRGKPSDAKFANTKKLPKGKLPFFCWNTGTFHFFSLLSLYIYIFIYYYSTTYKARFPILPTLFLFHFTGTRLEHPEHPGPTN
jgi:hypothetical protein